jgi:hypothetical protein
VPLAQYDFAVGPYLLDERLPTTNPLLPRKRAEGVDLSRPESRGFLGRGFSRAACGAALEQPAGELFVPLNRPGALTLEVEVEVEGTWSFNGRTLGPGTRWRIDAASVERGLNVLRVESAGDRRGCVRRLQLTEGTEWPPPWATVYERSP